MITRRIFLEGARAGPAFAGTAFRVASCTSRIRAVSIAYGLSRTRQAWLPPASACTRRGEWLHYLLRSSTSRAVLGSVWQEQRKWERRRRSTPRE